MVHLIREIITFNKTVKIDEKLFHKKNKNIYSI